jgi:UDP-N-acetylmuramyl-tripeptide synthetase
MDGLAERLGPATSDPELTSATLALADVRPGCLFVARRDWYGDTHEQVAAAFAAGAAAALVSRPEALPTGRPGAWADPEDPALGWICARLFGEPTRALRVFGVTGTKGKSTVAYLVEHLLRAMGERPALMGTVVYRLGDAQVEAPNTTPDALIVQQFAADARDRGATALVLEVSSHALQIGRVAGVAFDAVGLTNLGRDHLDFHGTAEAYAEAKARLFGPVLAASVRAGKAPTAAICVDAPGGAMMRRRVLPGVPVIEVVRSSVPGPGRLRVSEAGLPRLTGTSAVLDTEAGRLTVELPLIGAHNLENAALAVALVAGDEPARLPALWAALADFPGVPGRLEAVVPGVFVDYAHTPEAVAGTLAAVRARTTEPLTLVLGCGGDRDRGKRAPMARAAAEGADRVVLTSDNPRSEPAAHILDDMAAGVPPGLVDRVTRVDDRSAAIAAALAGSGVVVVAGKGHERTQTVGARRYHFDDREEVRRLARAREAGVVAEDAPLCWGLAAGEPPGAVLRRARRRPGGVAAIAVAGPELETARAALAALVGVDRVMAGRLEEVEVALAPRHRVALVAHGGPAPPLRIPEDVDAVFDRALDPALVLATVATRGPPVDPAPRRVPRLPAEP